MAVTTPKKAKAITIHTPRKQVIYQSEREQTRKAYCIVGYTRRIFSPVINKKQTRTKTFVAFVGNTDYNSDTFLPICYFLTFCQQRKEIVYNAHFFCQKYLLNYEPLQYQRQEVKLFSKLAKKSFNKLVVRSLQ